MPDPVAEPLIEYASHPDEDLVVMYRDRGDHGAMEQILRKYEPTVRARISPYFLIGSEREDLLQEGRIGLYKAVRDFDAGKIASFRSFAYLCIDRQIITAIKMATRQKHQPLNDSLSIDRPIDDQDGRTLLDTIRDARSVDPTSDFERRAVARLLRDRIFRDLSDLEADVLEHYLLGLTYFETSDKLERGVKSIDNALQRAKRKIASAVQELYPFLAD